MTKTICVVKFYPQTQTHTRMSLVGREMEKRYGDEEAAAVRLSALSGHSNLQELLTYVHPSAEEVSELYKRYRYSTLKESSHQNSSQRFQPQRSREHQGLFVVPKKLAGRQ